MYDNIGRKIKTLAKIIFAFLTAISVITGLLFLIDGADAILVLLPLIAGPLLAWISSWFLYGFGELIDKTSEIAENTRKNNIAPTQSTENKPLSKAEKLKKFRDEGLISEEEYNKAISELL